MQLKIPRGALPAALPAGALVLEFCKVNKNDHLYCRYNIKQYNLLSNGLNTLTI